MPIKPTKPVITPGGEPSPFLLRMILLAGVVVLAQFVLVLVASGIILGPPYSRVWQVLVTHMFSGHIGNAALGFKMGFHLYFLLYQSLVQDLIIILFLYPLTVQGYHYLWRLPVIGPHLKGAHDTAIYYKPYIAPYGAIGLAVLVFIPLFSTGPIVGTVLGYLLGLNPFVVLGSVIVGNTVSAVMCFVAMDKLNEINAHIGTYVLYFVIGILVLGTVVGFISRRWQQYNATRKAAAEKR